MSPEFSKSQYWEKTNRFLKESENANRFYLIGSPKDKFDVDVYFCLSMFPEDTALEKVRPVLFCEDQEGENVNLRALYATEFYKDNLNEIYPGNIDKMLSGIVQSFESGEPMCAVTFGLDKNTGEEVVCLHAIDGMSPKMVVDLIQRQAEIGLFGQSIDLPDF